MVGKGWHGDNQRHSDVAQRASHELELRNTLRQPMIKQNLVTVYHGTYADIDRFVRYDRVSGEYKSIGQNRFGTNFTDNKKFAQQFGKKLYAANIDTGKLLDLTHVQTFFELADALHIDRKKHEWELNRMAANSYYHEIKPPQSFYKPLEDLIHTFKLRPILKKKGYEGVIFNDMENGVPGKTYVIFDPENIYTESPPVWRKPHGK